MTDEPRIITPEQMVRGITNIGGPSVIDGDPDALLERVMLEAEKILLRVLTKMGVEITKDTIRNHCRRVLYKDDPHHIVEFRYDDKLLLRAMANVSGMGIDFLVPKGMEDAVEGKPE
jgi:hypothetical protein